MNKAGTISTLLSEQRTTYEQTLTSEEAPTHRQLKRGAWFAFVNREKSHWIHKDNGRVLDIERKHVADQNPAFVLVQPFPEDEDKKLVGIFFNARGIGSESLSHVNESLLEKDWHDKLREVLYKHFPDLRKPYNEFRGQTISSYARDWCSKNGVPLDTIFEAEGVEAFGGLSPEGEAELCKALDQETKSGQYTVTAITRDRNAGKFYLLLADISLLPVAFQLINDAWQQDYKSKTNPRYHLGLEFPEKASLDNIASAMPFALRVVPIGVKDASFDSYRRRIVRSGASHFRQRGFGLIDICGFSLMSSAEQLQSLLVLNLAVRRASETAVNVCDILDLESTFNRASTGDGFYLWHWSSDAKADVATFVFLASVVAQVRRLVDDGKTALKVKAAFTVGEVYTFFEAPIQMTSDEPFPLLHQNAVGPATNELARLITACRPGQFLIGDFYRPSSERDSGDALSAKKLVSRVNAALLPRELGKGELKPDWHLASELRIDPEDQPLLVFDKHDEPFRCWNLCGRMQARVNGEVALFDVGLRHEKAKDISSIRFASGAK